MTDFLQNYKSVIGQLNYALFLATVALLPFPQLALRYASVAWFATWVLECRFLSKPTQQDWRKAIPFLMFGAWYLWKIISGLWADDMDAYAWQLERYLFFGLLIPIGIWGVNSLYDWKQVCKVLVISCIAAVGVYVFTLYWVYNANYFNFEIGRTSLQSLTYHFFEGKISYLKHRLFLCSTEMMGIMALLYIRKDIVSKYGKCKGYFIITSAIVIIVTFIIATGSRASVLSGIALLSILLLYKLPIRNVRYKIAIILVACGIGLFILSLHPRMQEFNYTQLLSIRDIDKEDNIRLNIWGLALENPKDYSLYGLGAGQSTPYLLQKYADAGLTSYVQRGFATHNQYLAEWMEIGIPGLIFFILAWISIPFVTQKRARKSAIMLLTIYALNMLTDCMWGKFDGIALWCVWMVFIRLQSDAQTNKQSTGDTQ